MSVLSDKQILEGMQKAAIVIFPYNREQLNSGSYNIKLGAYHYMALRDAFVPGVPKKQLFQLSTDEDVTKSLSGWVMGDPDEWRETPVDIFPGPYGQDPTIEPLWSRCQTGDILLRPGDIALCHSEEFIGSLTGSITELRARSTLMRNCLSLAPSAGWGDVNFVNRWGFTIHNYGHRTIRLHPGDEVGQIIFHSIGDVLKPYQGSYVQKVDAEVTAEQDHSKYCQQLVSKWEPAQLLSSVQREAQKMLIPFTFTSEPTLDKEEVMLIDESSPLLEPAVLDERILVETENTKVLKSVLSRMQRSMNPKIADSTNIKKAIQHTHILCDALFSVIVQTHSREHFNLTQDADWRASVLLNVQSVIYTWTVSKYQIGREDLERLHTDFRNNRDRSGIRDMNLEHTITKIYREERDNYLNKLA